VPWELYQPESLGREGLDGITTERIRLQVDLQKVWERLDERQKQQFVQRVAPGRGTGSPKDLEGMLQQMRMDRIEVWIDGQGFTRRITMEMSLGGTPSIRMDLRMFDLNQDIIVELPKEYQELPAIPGR
jgi:hypothetical protein